VSLGYYVFQYLAAFLQTSEVDQGLAATDLSLGDERVISNGTGHGRGALCCAQTGCKITVPVGQLGSRHV
jgi:hypothetical protein